MTQKIIQIGNSTGIIIPKALLEKLGLKPGEEVVVEENTTMKAVTITKKGQKTTLSSVTPEFLAILDKVNKNYGAALKELAER